MISDGMGQIVSYVSPSYAHNDSRKIFLQMVITGIKQDPGIRNKQDRIQAEISGDIDNAISADEKKPNDSSRPSRKRRRA